MRSTRLVTLSMLCASSALIAVMAPAHAKDEASTYPAGGSVQDFAGQKFELFVPQKAGDRKPPWPLVIVLNGEQNVPTSVSELSDDGYVVCSPKPKAKGGQFATSESESILDIRDHLAKSLPLAKDRLHVVTIAETHGFSSFIAFNKRAVTASYTLVSSMLTGKAPTPEAKKRMGILFLGTPDAAAGDPAKALASLSDKVLTSEYRPGDGTSSPYFKYWLDVMDGRYTPGHDLSFDWIVDPPPAPSVKHRDPLMAPPPEPIPAMTKARDAVREKRVGALIYFWSEFDSGKTDNKNLQNSVFLDHEVRAAGKALVPVMVDRAKYLSDFSRMGLKSTPSVAVLDDRFNVIETFEGAVKAPLLVKALVKAATPVPVK